MIYARLSLVNVPSYHCISIINSNLDHVYRQLLRVFAHIYHAHYTHILHLRAEPHFNSLFAHFLSFGREYELLDPKDIRGSTSAPVGVGALWEKWREMGLLEA